MKGNLPHCSEGRCLFGSDCKDVVASAVLLVRMVQLHLAPWKHVAKKCQLGNSKRAPHWVWVALRNSSLDFFFPVILEHSGMSGLCCASKGEGFP